MASLTMTASCLGGSIAAAAATKQPSATAARRVVMVKASKGNVCTDQKLAVQVKEESSNSGRRDLMFAAVAAAACSVAKIAMADEPKNGSPEAKKKYAPVCVTMPTARICKN